MPTTDEPVVLTTNPDDFSPAYTRQVAAHAAEAVRVLNHATLSHGDGGLACPADVESVLRSVESLAGRLPQLLGQLASWERQALADGGIDSAAGVLVADAATSIQHAAGMARTLADALKHAANDATEVCRYTTDTGEENDD